VKPLPIYDLKKRLLAPRTAIMRRRHRDDDLDKFTRAAFELHYYRKPLYRYFEDVKAMPNLMYDVPIDEDSVVFDVGAYVGEWAGPITERHHPTIYAFEPAPGAHRKLVAMFADDPKVTPLDYGLGGHDQTASMQIAGPGSSIYDAVTGMNVREIQIRDIVSVLDELGLERLDLLKVNIEGGEYDLFDRLIDANWLSRIRLVMVQFHEWHPDAYARRRRIRRALRRSHREVWNYPWVWEYWSQTDTRL
jgi:FkbM family methyltransferase